MPICLHSENNVRLDIHTFCPFKSKLLPTAHSTSITLAAGLILNGFTEVSSYASICKVMDESHPPLEQRPQKEQKQRQNENLQPYHKEREARRWQRKEDWDDLYDVSDDENDHKNNSSTKSKAKPKRSGAGTEETSKDSWPRGLFRGLRLTLGHSKPKAVIGTDNLVEARRPRVVRSMDNLVDAQNPRLRATPFSEFPREENARPSAGSASKLARILPLKPEDIPDNEHPLRQHPMFDASGRIVLHDPPTSTAAMGVIPTPRKAKRLSLVPEREEVCHANFTAVIPAIG